MKKGEATAQMIIERSASIFNTKGIAATSMSDLMKVTQLSKGSLYKHFENKEILAERVVDYNLKLLTDAVISAVSKKVNPKDKLIAYIKVFRNPLGQPVPGGCPMMNFGVEADDLNEVVRKKVAKAVTFSQELVIDICKEGIAQGIFKPEWDYKTFAVLAFSLIEGGTLMSRINGKNDNMITVCKHLEQMIAEQEI